ncbi:MAG: thiosulfate oxidation carrier complex protein SoxZ [Xanthomonadales bacterium]|nr:thiosulfate oxidation carrier complex protein SoxZ [Xanthomonadales bacterium]
MGKPIKIKAKLKGDVAQVKVLMPHPMESGARVNAETGETVPKHYIEEVVCKHNGNVVSTAFWGTGVSKDPYMAFKFKGAKPGDKLEVSWRDNTGDTSVKEVAFK